MPHTRPTGCVLWLFDGQSARLVRVLSATLQLQDEICSLVENVGASGLAKTASSAFFSQIRAAVDKRVSGPVDRSMRVPLVSDVHYLAATLDPRVLDSQATDIATVVERSFRAIKMYFFRSPLVFSSGQLQ